ncbi:MAG: substrate-binding domain-containing protein [Spirochaetales bacterium]
MKKVIACLCVVFLFAGCTESSTPAVKAVVPDKPVIALVIKTLTNPFFIAMETGARRAETELGFVLKVKSGAQETSIDQQIAIIEDLVAEKVAAIVIAPGSSTELIPALKKAQDAGIKLVNIDNQLDPEASKAAGLVGVPFVSVDNVQGGYLAAKFLADRVKAPAQAGILEGIREAANANQRKAGAVKAFAENPNISLVASETANWKIDEGYEVAKAMFKAHPRITVLFAANDMMALGALQFLKEAGLSQVQVAGYDALDEARKALALGTLVATVDQQADQQGYIGAVTATKLLRGEPTEPLVTVDVRLITKATAGN